MRQFNTLVFDEYVDVTPTYTSTNLNRFLGKFDQIAIGYVADNLVGSPWLLVQQEHSADGRNWVNKNPLGEIYYPDLTVTPAGWGYDAGTTPSLGLVRLKISVANGNPSCHLRLYVTGRSR